MGHPAGLGKKGGQREQSVRETYGTREKGDWGEAHKRALQEV